MANSRKFLQPLNLLNATADPSPAVQGDVYYNSTSDKIRFYDGSQWNDVGSGGGGVTVSETAPASPELGDGWFKSSTSELFFYDGTFWIEATSTVENFLLFEVGETPPASPIEGQGWFNNVDGEFYIYDGTFWQQATNTIKVDLDQDLSPSLAADLDANNFGLDNVDYIDFNTATTTAATEGVLVWNSGEGTLDLGLKGGNVTLNLGQEQVALCYNGTGSTLLEGTVVYINGAQGQRPSIAKASASSEATSSKTFGVVTENIANGAEGFVATFGVVRGLNTSAYAEGAALWLSTTAGEFTTTMPTQPNHGVFIGYCVRQHATSGQIFVKIQNGYEIQELHNVLITSVADNHILSYDSATSLWKNQGLAAAIAEIDGATSGIDADLLDGQHGSYYTGYTDTAIANLIDTAPATLDTLNELAAALGDDPNFATTITTELSLKAPIASPTFTGVPSAPTAATGTSTTQIATTAFVQTAIAGFEALPDQTGNAGKYLTTDGTTASWGEVVGGSGGSVQTDVALSNSWWLGV